MQSIEHQPVEVRKAYAITELVKIVNNSKTIEEAKERCTQKLKELVDQGIVRTAQEDVLEVKAIVTQSINEIFTDKDNQVEIKNKKRRNGRGRGSGIGEAALARARQALMDGNEDLNIKAQSFFQRAESLRLQRNYKGALEGYKSAFNLDPSSSEYAFMLGLAFYHSLSFGEATDYLLKAVELSDHCQAIFYHWLLDAALLSGRGRSIAKNVTNMIENRNIDGGDKEKIIELINEINIKGLMPGVIWVAERIAGGVFPSEFSGFKR